MRIAGAHVLVVVLVCSGSWFAPLPVHADDAVSTDQANADQANLAPVGFTESVAPFLREFCAECHGPDEQKGDRRFDLLPAEIGEDAALVDYQDIVDQLNLGEMPPEDAAQPSPELRRRVVDWLSASLDRYHEARKGAGGQTVLRRINAREYRNTTRDLLRLNMTMFDPTTRFPRDQVTEHLDNVGEALVTSGHLLARYLDAADQVIVKAIGPESRPSPQTWVFRDGFDQQPEIDQVHRRTNQFNHLTLYDVIGADKHEGAYAPIHAFADGAPIDGIYEIRFQAAAVNRLHPYDPKFLGTDPNEPLRLGIVAGDHSVGSLHLPQPIEPLLAEVELSDETSWYTVRVWLDAGYTPRFTFQNGLMDVRELWSKLIRKYPNDFPKGSEKGIVSARFNAIQHGKLPQIHVYEVEIEGPIVDQWPTASHRVLFGDDASGPLDVLQWDEPTLREHVRRFTSLAYRRPATSDDVDRVMEVIRSRNASGRSPLEAYGDGLKAVLCSPHFLFLEEPGESELSPYALASRLSYFIWSSLPDDELNRLAASGEISSDEVLREQVARMLRDPKSDAFVEGFLGSWLGMRELGATPPDRAAFKDFYHYDLDHAMRRETFLFTRYLLDQNLGARHFLDADFTFVNKPLARHYGIAPPDGYAFEKVALTDRRRGGLMGQASVLTLTANGIDTSPVVRGVWLLENLLGTPPSPPPPDVEPLDPDVRGAKTIRDQLDKHRSVPSCYDCHRKIDPLGFALENFDPIGRWRDSYPQGAKIDASGELPGGKTFHDIEGLKLILLDQADLFAASLVKKLMAYATGRHIGPADRPELDSILQSTTAADYPLRDLITEVVLSRPFRTP